MRHLAIRFFQWLGLLLLFLIIAVAAYWWTDLPWRAQEIEGSIVSWSASQNPTVMVANYYKMALLVRADDGRMVGVFSERRVAPAVGERVHLQERFGLFGTHSFVELPK